VEILVQDKDREVFLKPDFAMNGIIKNTLLWMERLHTVQKYAYDLDDKTSSSSSSSSSSLSLSYVPLQEITFHSYSRGFISERILFDVWTVLSQWNSRSDRGIDNFLALYTHFFKYYLSKYTSL